MEVLTARVKNISNAKRVYMFRIIKLSGKIAAAGVTAIAAVSLLLCAYKITPVHLENTAGNTDYVWPSKSVWVDATEGISFGQYDEKGFNNKTVIENPDIIVVGSSHMEAANVMQDENAAYLLGQKLDGKYSVYNMGISGHNFAKICQYLPANMEIFEKVPKVTVMETDSVQITPKNVEEVIKHSVEYTPSHSSGILETVQKIPFFRLMYRQIDSGLLDLFMPSHTAENTNNASENIDYTAYENIFSYLENIEATYGTQIVIFYHPFETLQSDGGIDYGEDSPYLKAFTEQAEKHNITFADMTSSFENMYYTKHHVAHGFATGKLGIGHLNKYGHAEIAEELYKAILELEDGGLLCK